MAEDPDLYPTLARTNNGSRHRPLVIFDSDDEDDSPKPTPLAKAPTSKQNAPLQVDRSNAPSNASSQGSIFKTSPNAHVPSYPAPVRATPQLQMGGPTPIAVPIPGSAQPGATPEGGETFNLAQIANDPYELRKTTDEAEKDLKDLFEQSIGGEDVEVDMEQAIVAGFSKDWKLLAHQVQGRAWLGERESGKKSGGILGDDMGLGKTTQIVSRIVDYKLKEEDDVKRKETKKYGKTTLVVAPASVVTQWEAELKKMAPCLRVLAHHGASRSKDGARLAQYDVVITSYPTLSAEWKNHDGISNKEDPAAKGKGKSKERVVESESEESEDDFVAAAKRLKAKKVKAAPKKPAALFERPWLRVILDEAHTIKGRTTQGAKACYALQAKFRWCLTGTPIQNSVEELFSLLHFLQVRPLNDWDTFKAQIANPIKAGRSAVPMKRLHVVLSAIMLRRTKTQVVNGKPILSLPDRTVNMVECEFDQDEQEFYNALVERTELTLNKFAKSGLTNNFTSVLVLLLRLRQACCHPELCMKNVKNDLDAIEPKVKETDKEEGEEEADDLADLLGAMTVKESHCELCDDLLEPGVKSKYCPDCEVQVVLKARRKSLPSGDDLEVQTLPSSAKTRKLVEILEKIEEDSEGQDKTIVFSQFTSFLDIVEKFLRKAGLKFVRYDGSMKLDERSAALDKFRNNPKYNIALISFKAGSTGLNLTAANHVILLDLWWNPALEDQAFDRAHRFGQKKDVFIHKLVIPKTVEERIQELQNKKRELATAALTGDKLGKNSRLRMDELLQLFAHDAAE
ncbi:hypothetical protein M407DRAFT_20805 [Tulasnella calospora MUT 4182]|uniref:Helicase ATP-binding domain-containing protein n=1 Tax=Tulasnella calospora MUT 4182 TaxID=1051891 RepID=A0A0C3QPE3_9AGAM|nr:hypothetical protein M407DRAFT_20805 [Tulasnella calospora MUT 4182]